MKCKCGHEKSEHKYDFELGECSECYCEQFIPSEDDIKKLTKIKMKEILMASEIVNNANFEQTNFRSMFFKGVYNELQKVS